MNIITWLIVGLVAGLLAAVTMRSSRFGVLGDIVLGVAGACAGGWSFHQFGWRAPFEGTAGVIAVALLGAVALLVMLRVLETTNRFRRRA